ncbi:cupin domain protein [Bordetella holmesii 30539]|uniref:PF05899 family protein n=1 Tax=Bordetella holmesii CDC-H585-BH TaxID=1331206 RepID=A0A158M2X6_9BORD|nr:cupin domain protein [Bordetella holmesii ATCC 51541]AIT26719.1 cupin domain protein [Bordetella holmesii 44057]AMD48903.1 hypothetical protein F783_008770 [Bordetella holmesii F627]EWM42982.1 cupin domain protein [Bordetella holmesii 41130]EWM47305.1 cupin domain protein [Bordetella holmesii 35009]EWM51461.1 cupin domain protein [Bordetella holmesii 70147]EXF88712.1 cupin domain protein [Bordetella holmesii 30539]KAK76428.1 PF05899 family protein [Bordetella holmesii H620]KAK85784.1 PF0
MSDSSSRLVRFGTGPLIQAEIGKPRRPIEGNTEFRTVNAFEANEGRVLSGIWESTAGKFRSDTTGYIEFGYILEGQARLVDPDGTVHELRPGDPFIMPQGYKGHWEVDTFVKKVYFITHVA